MGKKVWMLDGLPELVPFFFSGWMNSVAGLVMLLACNRGQRFSFAILLPYGNFRSVLSSVKLLQAVRGGTVALFVTELGSTL